MYPIMRHIANTEHELRKDLTCFITEYKKLCEKYNLQFISGITSVAIDILNEEQLINDLNIAETIFLDNIENNLE